MPQAPLAFRFRLSENRGAVVPSLIAALLVTPSARATLCLDVISDGSLAKLSAPRHFRPSPIGDRFVEMRQNAWLFWRHVESSKNRLVAPRGLVAGDPHILNYRDELLPSGARRIMLYDIDDVSPSAPLIGDFVRLMLTVEASPYPVPHEQLLDSYIRGLQGRSLERPLTSILKITNMPAERSNQKREEVIAKRFSNGRWAPEGEVRDIESAPREHRRLFLSLQDGFEAALRRQASGRPIEIISRGYRVKTSGGSAGLPRYWYAVRDGNRVRLIEFKAEVEPAPAGRSLSLTERGQMIEGLMSRFREPVDRWFAWVQLGQYDFNLREKVEDFIDVDPADAVNLEPTAQQERSQQARDLALWIAHDLGRTQSQEKAGLELRRLMSAKSAGRQLDELLAEIRDALNRDSVRR